MFVYECACVCVHLGACVCECTAVYLCVCVCVCVYKAVIECILFVRRRHERWNLKLFNSCLKFVKPESPVGIEIKRVKRLHTDKDKSKD